MYEFLATVTGPIEVRARGLANYGGDALLRAFDADGNELTYSDDSTQASADSRIQVEVIAGETYFFDVTGISGSPGEYSIEVAGGFARMSRGQVLRIDGDEGNNVIRLIVAGSHYKVFRDGSTLTFDRSNISRVSIAAKGGNDSVAIGSGVARATVHGEGGDDTLVGGDGHDILIGYEGNDHIYGGNGDDTLYGNEGEDYIDGGAGDDRIVGGSGRDTLSGGDGNDTFLGRDRTRDLIYGGRGYDTVQGDENDHFSKIEDLLS